MTAMPTDDGLRLAEREIDLDGYDEDADGRLAEERSWHDGEADTDLESLRGAFVDAFNSRDLDEILGIVHPDVEVPDIAGEDGIAALIDEIESIWEGAPAVLLTRAFLDGRPCAVAWLPDEDGGWTRAALVCFEHEGDRLTLVAVPDDVDALERVEAEEPTGEQLDEWADWAEWDRGEETVPRTP